MKDGRMKLRARTRVEFEGIVELAKELGVSRWHLRAVLGGRRRPGAELARKLKERHIKTAKLRPPAEQWV